MRCESDLKIPLQWKICKLMRKFFFQKKTLTKYSADRKHKTNIGEVAIN